jgi:hypothetical protein
MHNRFQPVGKTRRYSDRNTSTNGIYQIPGLAIRLARLVWNWNRTGFDKPLTALISPFGILRMVEKCIGSCITRQPASDLFFDCLLSRPSRHSGRQLGTPILHRNPTPHPSLESLRGASASGKEHCLAPMPGSGCRWGRRAAR